MRSFCSYRPPLSGAHSFSEPCLPICSLTLLYSCSRTLFLDFTKISRCNAGISIQFITIIHVPYHRHQFCTFLIAFIFLGPQIQYSFLVHLSASVLLAPTKAIFNNSSSNTQRYLIPSTQQREAIESCRKKTIDDPLLSSYERDTSTILNLGRAYSHMKMKSSYGRLGNRSKLPRALRTSLKSFGNCARPIIIQYS